MVSEVLSAYYGYLDTDSPGCKYRYLFVVVVWGKAWFPRTEKTK